MRLGDRMMESVPVIPTGCPSLDRALGIGGYPRGRVLGGREVSLCLGEGGLSVGKNLNKAGRGNDRVLTPETIWRPCLEALRIAAGAPQELFDLDPAGAPGQDASFVREVLIPEHGRDGLAESWADKLVWFNGPYSQFQYPKRFPWFERARESTFTCAFMPARTAAPWWQDLALESPMVLLLEGRVVHKNAPLDKRGRPCGAPFAQCIMYFGLEAEWVPPPKLRGLRLDTVTRFR